MKLARPLLSFLLGILVVLTVAPCPLYAAVVEEREFRYEAERFRLTPQADGTTRVTLRGAAREEAAGHPDLPLIGERIELPVGLRLAEVRVVGLETASLASGVRVPSAERPRRDGDGVERTAPDPAVYGSSGFVPATVARVGLQGFERGRNVAYVVIAPARWSPATGELERVERIRLQLVLEPDAARPLERERVVPEWESGTTAAALPSVPTVEPFMATQLPSLLGSPVQYVIVTDDEMAATFQQLADWKTASGVPAVVRTMSLIRQEYPMGADDAERVRSFIRDAYVRWGTKWVLLGGDTGLLPARFAYSGVYGGGTSPTDLYFSCLDGSWNGVWIIDMLPKPSSVMRL